MSLEKKLLHAAVEATGDETIADVAYFQPKGTSGAMMAGAAIGSAAGGAAGGDGWGEAIGRGIGAGAGMLAADYGTAAARDLPPQVCVAVSATEVYLLAMPKVGVSHVEPFAKIHRDKLGVEVHQRMSVRTVVLEDLETGARFPLETPRINPYHNKAMVELLMISGEHQVEPEDEAAPA